MKTLHQVEPRIPLVAGSPGVTVNPSGQININQPGSYYLTGNVNISLTANGINIIANGVTLDLMGYAIRYLGADFSGDAIYVNGSNVLIQNGNIISTTTHDGSNFSLAGFLHGVNGEANRNNITVKNLSIQGVRIDGIKLFGTSSLVENCQVLIAGSVGIRNSQGIVKNSLVQTTGSTGILAHSCIDCRVNQSVGTGISATIVANSSALSLESSGISAGSSVTGSFGQSASTFSFNHGIVSFDGTVTNSKGIAAGGSGIRANIVEASRGSSTGTNGLESSGIRGITVTNSWGRAEVSGGGNGILADIVQASYGVAEEGAMNGINAELAINSYGARNGNVAGQYGLVADQANSCRVFGDEVIVHKYNMP